MKNNKLLREISKKGYIVIKKVLKKTEANELKNLCISLNKKNYKKKIKKPKKSKHKLNSHEQDDIIYNLQNKSYKFIKIASNKKILKIATDYLNYGSYKKEHIILHQLTGRSPISNAGDQTLHLDSRIPGLKFPIKVVATVMLEDFNYSNGATRLFPSSHLLKRFPKKKDNKSKKIKFISGKAGDVLIMNGSLWHAGSKNFTSKTRWSILITYVRWFLKQAFDMPTSLPPNLKKSCSKDQLKLLGLYSKPPKNEFERINALKK